MTPLSLLSGSRSEGGRPPGEALSSLSWGDLPGPDCPQGLEGQSSELGAARSGSAPTAPPPPPRFHGHSRLLQLGQEGKVPLKSARLLFEASEKARRILESHFRLETPLYFSYTHLVCRSAIDGTITRPSARAHTLAHTHIC